MNDLTEKNEHEWVFLMVLSDVSKFPSFSLKWTKNGCCENGGPFKHKLGDTLKLVSRDCNFAALYEGRYILVECSMEPNDNNERIVDLIGSKRSFGINTLDSAMSDFRKQTKMHFPKSNNNSNNSLLQKESKYDYSDGKGNQYYGYTYSTKHGTANI